MAIRTPNRGRTPGPAALQQALDYSALDALFGRRSRRFALGASLPGPLAYESTADPLPLSPHEEAILVAAATGVTGVARDEWPFPGADGPRTGADKLTSYIGRSFPSPLATHSTEVFWTNDDGAFVLPQRDAVPERYRQLTTQEERQDLLGGAIKLQDGRLEIPRQTPNLFGINHWIANIEGSTLFIPIADVTRQCIAAMLLYFDEPHRYHLHDPRLGGDPLRSFVRDGWLDDGHPVDLWDFERWQMVDANGVEAGAIVQSLLIATQALGLGGHPFSGGKGRVTMGGESHWHAAGGTGPADGLGFTFHRVPDDAPVGAGELLPVGLEGVFEGYVPPFHASMEAAVDAVVELRRRPALTPWRDAGVAAATGRPSPEAVAATKQLCSYIYETYGRFPATIDPFLTTVWYQAHHLDIGFYDAHYPPEAVPDNVRTHLRDWHGL